MARFSGKSNYDRGSSISAAHPFRYWTFGDWGTYLNLDDPSKPVPTQLSMKEAYRIFGPAVEAMASAQVNDYRTAMTLPRGHEKTDFYPVVNSFSGSFEPVPKPLESDFPRIKSNNQPRFANAKRTGDIVVSSYQRGSVRVEFEPKILLSSKGRTVDYYMDLWRILGLPNNPTTKNPVKIGGYTFAKLPVVVTTRQDSAATESLGDYNFDMSAFKSKILDSLKPDSDTVSKCVASANSGTVDLATSLAELPKTGKSILNGASMILRLYKDAKNREFRLQDRVKKVRYQWDKELSLAANRKEVDAIAHLNKVKQFEKTTNNLLHEIASVWLTYRLEVIPLASSIESSIDGLVLGDAFTPFVRFRETSTYSIAFMDSTIPVTFRSFIKRSLIVGAEWQSFFSVNLTKTLWELAWLSFVVDRYVAVGDWISANLSRPMDYTLQEGATNSWMIDSTIRIPGKRITVKLRKRDVFSPDSYCPLRFPSSRTTDQRLDHLALAWAILTKKL